MVRPEELGTVAFGRSIIALVEIASRPLSLEHAGTQIDKARGAQRGRQGLFHRHHQQIGERIFCVHRIFGHYWLSELKIGSGLHRKRSIGLG